MAPEVTPTPEMATIVTLLPSYAAALAAAGHRPRGRARYLSQLRRLDTLLESLPVSQITAAHCRRAQEHLAARCKPATLQVALSAMRSFFGWYVIEQIRQDNPAATLRWPKRGAPARTLLSVETLTLLRTRLDAVPTALTARQQERWRRNRLAILLMSHAGLRLAEVTALRWADVSVPDHQLTVQDGKGGKRRVVPLNDTLHAALAQAAPHAATDAVISPGDGTPFAQPNCLAHVFERWLRRELHLVITAHQLRHAFATSLYHKGTGVRVIQELLGHASLETTMWYLGVSSEEAMRAVQLLNTA